MPLPVFFGDPAEAPKGSESTGLRHFQGTPLHLVPPNLQENRYHTTLVDTTKCRWIAWVYGQLACRRAAMWFHFENGGWQGVSIAKHSWRHAQNSGVVNRIV
jgi:hypothetical protein